MNRLALIFAMTLFMQGCASFVEMRVPKEFKGGKIKEDPPLGALPAREALCAKQV